MVAIFATLTVPLHLFSKELRGSYVLLHRPKVVDPIFTLIASIAYLLFAVLILFDISATTASLISTGIVACAALFRDCSMLQARPNPIGLLILVTMLFLGVDLLNHLGVGRAISHGTHNALAILLWSNLAANFINILPAYLLFESIILPWGR